VSWQSWWTSQLNLTLQGIYLNGNIKSPQAKHKSSCSTCKDFVRDDRLKSFITKSKPCVNLIGKKPHLYSSMNGSRRDIRQSEEAHRELVGGRVLVDDVEHSVVIGEVRLVIHCPLECGIGAFEHRRCVALKTHKDATIRHHAECIRYERHTHTQTLTTTDSINTLCVGCGCTPSSLSGSSRRTTADKPASVTLLRASSSTCTGLLRSSAAKLRSSTAYKLGSVPSAPDSELAPGWQTPGLEENSSGQWCWKVTLWLLPRREAVVG